MKKYIFFLILSLLLLGCEWDETEFSSVMSEQAKVAVLIYTPKTHGSGISPTFDSYGDIGLSFTSVNIKQRYAVVFQCRHGKFIIENDQKKAEELFHRLSQGQEVTVTYKEVYHTKYAKVNGKAKVLGRALYKYDFLDAK